MPMPWLIWFFVVILPVADAADIVYDGAGNTKTQGSGNPAAPTISGQPVALNATGTGDPASFSVNIASTLPVTYQWYFNGTLISGATRDTLLLNNPTFPNEGLYTVTVTNTLGSVTSNPSRLAIDTNGNGLGDNWELQYFGNLDQRATGDFDGDQLTNLEEFLNGTNPTIRDAYYWTAASGDFDNPANWNWKRVPGLGDTAFINSGEFTINGAGAAPKVNLTVNQPYTFSAIANTTLALNGTWTLNGPVTLTTGRTLKVTSGNLTINGAATINGANLIAQGNNTKFTINGLTTYTQPNNTSVTWRAGDPSVTNVDCELNFPNLTTITGGVTTLSNQDFFFNLTAWYDASLNLPALGTITVPVETVSNADSGVKLTASVRGTLNAPALTVFNDATALSQSWLIANSSGRLNLPLLAAPEGVQLDINGLSTPQQFTSLARTWYFRLSAGTVAMTLSNVRQLRTIIAMGNGTKLSFPNVTTYTQPNNTSVTWRAGDPSVTNVDCELNFPNLTTITGGVTTLSNQDFFFNLTAWYDASLNLPALGAITVPVETVSNADSGVKLTASVRGTLNAPALTVFNDATALSQSWLIANSSGRLNLPLLAAPEGVQLDINGLSTPQQFTSLARTWYFRLSAGTVAMTLSNVSHIRNIIAMGNGTKLSFPNVTTYTQPNNTSVVWRAGDTSVTNVDCELNFPNLTTITGGITTTSGTSYFFDITARNSAMINLPHLTTISVPVETVSNATSGVRLYALSKGVLNAGRLASFTDQTVPGASRIEASADSFYALTSLRQSGLTGIVLSGITLPTGPVVLNPPVITSPTVVSAYTGNAFSYQMAATNSPYVFELSAVPQGLAFDADTGLLSGEPVGTGTLSLTMSALNADGIGSSPLTLNLSAPPSILAPADLYAWWTGNVDGRDSFGSQHGTLQGGVTIQPGRVGNAFSFTATGQGVTLPQSPALDLSRLAAWTIEAWIYPTSFVGSSNPTIYALGDYRVSFGLDENTGKLESWINNSNRLNTTQSVALNRWTHVAMSYNGATRVFYINGVNVGSGTAPAVTDVDVTSSIGNVTGSPSNSQFFGKIDELAVYGRTLTDVEVAEIHATGISGKSFPASIPLVVITQPASATVLEGNPGGFNVVAIGPGSLTYQWFKDELLLTGQTSATLSLSETQAIDGGEYSVRVTASEGSILSQSALLSIKPSQVIANNVTVSGLDQAVTDGTQYFRIAVPPGQDELVIKLQGGTGNADLYLSRGTEPTLANYLSRSILTGNNETIRMTNPLAGTWQIMVRAATPYSGVSITAFYRILPPPPVIVTQPQPMTRVVGQAVTFTVEATGEAPVTYQWYRGAFLLAGQTGSSLQLPSLQPTDAGDYSVRVTNDGGTTVSQAARLTVLSNPSYLLANSEAVTGLNANEAGGIQYFNIVVPSGQDELLVKLQGGTGNADLYLSRGTEPTSSFYQFRSILEGNIDSIKVTRPLEGDWRIMVRAISAYANLTLTATYRVLPPPPVIVTQPQVMTRLVGQAVTLSVAATGDGPITYQWYRGTLFLTGQTGSTLQLPSLELTDAGEYTVRVTNDGGTTVSQMAQLTVLPNPSYLLANSETVAGLNASEAGDVKFFRIEVPPGQRSLDFKMIGGGGNADMYIRWGSPPTISSYYTSSVIGGVGPTEESFSFPYPQAGEWHVMLHAYLPYSNVSIQATYEADVSPPVIYGHPEGVTAVEGQTIRLSVEAEGALPLEYQWLKDGIPMDGETDSSLELASVATSDAGEYTVQVSNPYGTALSDPATLLVDPYLPVALDNGVIVTGLASPVAGSKRYFKINVPSGQLQLTIRIAGGTGDADLFVSHQAVPSLDFFDFGNYLEGNNETVMLDNPAAGDWHIMLDAYEGFAGISLHASYTSVTSAPVIIEQPVSLSLVEGSFGSLFVVASGVPTPTFQWYLNGEALEGENGSGIYVYGTATGTAGEYTVSVTNSFGSVTSAPALLSVTATFDSWRAVWFNVEELELPSISGPGADPDQDGRSNLLEYAFGLDPQSSDSTDQPSTGILAGNFTLSYTKLRSDLAYTVETATSLETGTWSVVGVSQGTPDSNNRVTASVPMGASARFLRLSVRTTP